MPARPIVLIVEDDQDLLRAIESGLEDRFAVHTATSVAAARTQLAGVDLIITDVRLPDGSALDVVRAAEALPRFPRIIAMSGTATAAEAFDLSQAGAIEFLTKPFDLSTLDATVERVLAARVPVEPIVVRRLGQSTLVELVNEVREIMVRRAMSKADTKTGAARVLGVSRQALQQILKARPRGSPPADDAGEPEDR